MLMSCCSAWWWLNLFFWDVDITISRLSGRWFLCMLCLLNDFTIRAVIVFWVWIIDAVRFWRWSVWSRSAYLRFDLCEAQDSPNWFENLPFLIIKYRFLYFLACVLGEHCAVCRNHSLKRPELDFALTLPAYRKDMLKRISICFCSPNRSFARSRIRSVVQELIQSTRFCIFCWTFGAIARLVFKRYSHSFPSSTKAPRS